MMAIFLYVVQDNLPHHILNLPILMTHRNGKSTSYKVNMKTIDQNKTRTNIHNK